MASPKKPDSSGSQREPEEHHDHGQEHGEAYQPEKCEQQVGVPASIIDPAIQKRVVRKLDRNLVPLVTALYLLAFLDRSNIGNARIAGMTEDLRITGNSDRYDWLLTIFYISYIVFEFQAIMWKVIPPHYWAALVVFSWGLFSAVQSATTNWSGMMALRFLLGWAEAGFGPGIPYLLSFFYLRDEIGIRCAIFLGAAPLASTFAGALAYGITSGDTGLAQWRLLFLVEGLPTILMAAVAFFFLPDSPASARFLNAEEKEVARLRAQKQVGSSSEERTGGINWKELGAGLLDIKAWFTALMYFSCNVSFSSLPVFLPTIINEMGFARAKAQGLTAPPFFISWIVTITSAFIADRTKQRGLTIMVMSIVGGVGYVILATTQATGVRYFGSFLAAAGIFPCIANILPWVLNNQGTDTRRGAGIILLNWIGQCGPLLGTRLYPSTEKPYYVKGMFVCAAFMFFTTLLAFGLRTLLWWENRNLDRKFGTVEELEEQESASGQSPGLSPGEENYGPRFRIRPPPSQQCTPSGAVNTAAGLTNAASAFKQATPPVDETIQVNKLTIRRDGETLQVLDFAISGGNNADNLQCTEQNPILSANPAFSPCAHPEGTLAEWQFRLLKGESKPYEIEIFHRLTASSGRHGVFEFDPTCTKGPGGPNNAVCNQPSFSIGLTKYP
ncbi:MFS general substrate transporter [Pseudovirgaria hyperparasitica]|uniref:MFS general substrate transporter n=1 Tax=Pseudovirgaria hyperparasitica TaxID=470096 RepID=A0A6A6WDU5_9PEZI|nr:MFS general substrate transporter [Pseudovirgaria hyperparasitica]KAF2760016.1 MFS general substrate transporter [Pseudovirgaria hyperparasitica]